MDESIDVYFNKTNIKSYDNCPQSLYYWYSMSQDPVEKQYYINAVSTYFSEI